MKSVFTLAALVALAACGGPSDAPELSEAWRLETGLASPESVVYDPVAEVFYISNISGPGQDKDGDGYISKVDADGGEFVEKWATGLDGPKGLAIVHRSLFAADIDAIVEIDIATATVADRHPVEGAERLNDLSAGPDGAVYATDTTLGAVYRLQDAAASLLVQSDDLRSANGVAVIADKIYVLAARADAETPRLERMLQTLTAEGVATPVQSAKPLSGWLDGVEPDGRGGYVVSEIGPGRLWRISPDGQAARVYKSKNSLNDMVVALDQNLVVIPMLSAGQVVALRMTWPGE